MSLNDLRMHSDDMDVKTDDSLKYQSFTTNLNLNVRKSNNKFKRFSSQDINIDDNLYMKLNKPELIRNSAIYRTMSEEFSENIQGMSPLRRGSSFIKMLSTESDESRHYGRIGRLDTRGSSLEDDISRRSSKSDTRRESSFGRISEERDYDFDQSANKENMLKPGNVELNVPELKKPEEKEPTDGKDAKSNASVVNITPSYYINLIENINNIDYTKMMTSLNEQDGLLGGEWDSFWRQYNCSSSDYMSNPYTCPSNSMEEASHASDSGSMLAEQTHVFLTSEELAEALDCAERLNELLRRASRRAAAEMEESKPGFFSRKNSSKQRMSVSQDDDKQRNLLKSSNSNCITLLLNNTGVGDMLKRVLSRRRDFILSSESRKSQ